MNRCSDDYTVILIEDEDNDLRSICVGGEICICRICHDYEQELNLESPCACSGTVKFAHRDCIQRWCNEKGNTTCEICLQKFEPGYASPPKKSKTQLIETRVIVSLEDPIIIINGREEEDDIDDSSECVAAADRSVSCCRTVAVIFTALFLIRHIFALLNGGVVGTYPFSLLTMLLVKISGIVFPMCILLRILAVFHRTLRQSSSSSPS